MPPTAVEYTKAGLPWFEYYGGDLKALEGAEKLAGLDSVAVKKLKKGEGVLADNEAVEPKVGEEVREGEGEGGGVLGYWENQGHAKSAMSPLPPASVTLR